MLNFLKKLFIPDSDAPQTDEPGGKKQRQQMPLSRQELSDTVYARFVEQLKFESTREGLLFPTAFTVLLDQLDYDTHRASLGFTVKELSGRMVKVVRQCLKQYPDYRLHAYNWVFRFIPVEADAMLPPELGELRPQQGNPLVLMQLYSEEALDDNQLTGRVVGTMKTKNSLQVIPTGLNIQALGPVDRRSEGKFVVKIEGLADTDDDGPSPANAAAAASKPRKQQVKANQHPTGARALSNRSSAGITLRAEDGAFIDRFGGRTTRLTIDNPAGTIELHGRDGSTNSAAGTTIVRIDSQEVFNPHLIIHCNNDGTYSFTPMGNVTVDEIPYNRDPDARHQLCRNSTVMIDGAVQFVFSTKPTIT